MTDSAPLSDSEQTDLLPDADVQAPPGFQAPTKSRYRPSESWAKRWLGNPAD